MNYKQQVNNMTTEEAIAEHKILEAIYKDNNKLLCIEEKLRILNEKIFDDIIEFLNID